MRRNLILLLCVGLSVLSVSLFSKPHIDYLSPLIIGLAGVFGFIHQLTFLSTRLVGELVAVGGEENDIASIKVCDTLTLHLRVAINNDDKWKKLVGRQIIAEYANSLVTPPRIFKITLNNKAEA